MIKKFFKDITGITAAEERVAQDKQERLELEERVRIRKEQVAEQKKIKKEQAEALRIQQAEKKATPKEIATRKGEPYVAVLETHINKENIRNGFFELDWNDEFIVQLRLADYGFEGDPDEEIVDRWFRDLARNILADEGQDTTRSSGYINVSKLGDGRSEVQ
jgi:hypothetical protein